VAREYALAEVVLAGMDTLARELHKAIPGRVVSFDRTTKLAVVEGAISLPLPTLDGEIVYDPFPTWSDVPVGFPCAGGLVFAFDLAAGDPVALIFSDSPCAQYLVDGNIEEPLDTRRHSVGYPFALPGGWRPDAKQLATAIPEGGLVIGLDSGEPLITISAADGIKLGRSSTDFVALASLVKTELDKIAHAFSTFMPGSGGASFPDAYTTASPVAASVVKAE
jgi:hypothetical protein